MPRPRRHPSNLRRAATLAWRLLLSYASLMLAATLVLLGLIAGWAEGGAAAPALGIGLAAGIAVVVLGSRVIRCLTGHDPIDPPPWV
jgi:uncharacterized SAM-binding protein YcdF (DUF218 family)